MPYHNLQEITSKDNKQVKYCAKLIRSKKYRSEEKRFVAEGMRLCEDAIRSGLTPVQTFVTKEMLDKCHGVLEASRQIFLIHEEQSAKISETQAPQGIFCVFPTLDNIKTVDTMKWQHIVVLSSLQDPGNLGAIVRTAEAFGIDGLILSEDCPDLYSSKVLRSTMGGVFRLPICRVSNLKETLDALKQEGFLVYGAALLEESRPITEVSWKGRTAAVIGNEGNGLSRSVLDACTGQIIIPMKGKAESLNAAIAASIIIWEMSRS